MAASRPLLLIVLAVALAGCGGSSTKTVSGQPLVTAADATAKQPSEKVAMQAKIDLSGQPLSLKGGGAFAGKKGKLRLRFTLAGLGSSILDEVFDGDIVWLRSPLLTSQLRGKHWLKFDLSKRARAFGFDLNALTGQTPASALGKLRLEGQVSKLGTEKIDGVETTHYHETPSGGDYRSVDAWVDDQNLVRQLKLDYDAQVDPAAKDKAHTVLTMNLSDFGTPVGVTPPPASDVADSSQVGK